MAGLFSGELLRRGGTTVSFQSLRPPCNSCYGKLVTDRLSRIRARIAAPRPRIVSRQIAQRAGLSHGHVRKVLAGIVDSKDALDKIEAAVSEIESERLLGVSA